MAKIALITPMHDATCKRCGALREDLIHAFKVCLVGWKNREIKGGNEKMEKKIIVLGRKDK